MPAPPTEQEREELYHAPFPGSTPPRVSWVPVSPAEGPDTKSQEVIDPDYPPGNRHPGRGVPPRAALSPRAQLPELREPAGR